jgi:hypothetical protein
MQRQTGITATITATTGFQFGTTAVAAYALLPAPSAGPVVHDPHPVHSKRDENSSRENRWRSRPTDLMDPCPMVASERLSGTGMPPRLWAALVLSRSLCG